MAIGAAVDNASETAGDFNKEAWDKYNALRTAILVEHDTDGVHDLTAYVTKALFDANTILYATTDNTPVALAVAASRIVGRASTGAIAALTAAQVLTLINVEAGATADQTEAEILALLGLTSAEVDQLEAIGTTTISSAQWGALGALVEWTGWTPTLTGGADLSGYTTARYCRIGDLCFFVFDAETKNVTTGGAIEITLPFTAATTGAIFEPCADIYDGTNWIGKSHIRIGSGSDSITVYKAAALGEWAGTETGVVIRISGFFEIA